MYLLFNLTLHNAICAYVWQKAVATVATSQMLKPESDDIETSIGIEGLVFVLDPHSISSPHKLVVLLKMIFRVGRERRGTCSQQLKGLWSAAIEKGKERQGQHQSSKKKATE